MATVLDRLTLDSALTETRDGHEQDYRAWGDAAAALVMTDIDLTAELVRRECRAAARNRLAGETARTRDGIARVLADTESGQMLIWQDTTDSDWLRREGRRLVSEGHQKVQLGTRMLQAADCIDAHPGLTARDAWVAEGLDVADIEAVDEQVA